MNKDKKLRRENNTLEIKRNLRTSDYFKTKHSFTKMLERFRRKRRDGEKIYGTSTLFIGVRGVVSRKHLDMTVEIFPGDACPLRCSEGDIFTRVRDFLHGIGSSESTPFPELLVLGN
jgi:hypothetical protein